MSQHQPSCTPCGQPNNAVGIYALAAVSSIFFLTTIILGTVLVIVLIRRRRNTRELVRRDYGKELPESRYWENEIPTLENNQTPKERAIWFPETESSSTFGGSSQPTNNSKATAKKGTRGWFTKKPVRKAPAPPNRSEYAVPGTMFQRENPSGLSHEYRKLDVTKVEPSNPYARPITRGNSMPTIHCHSLS